MFLRGYSTSLLKTLWKKEKWLVKTTLSLSHSVFYPFITNFSTLFIPPQTKVVGVYWNQPVRRAVEWSVCPQNLVPTTPPTVSVQFA